MLIDLGQVGFKIRHAWFFLSCPVGSFGLLAPVVPRWGTTGGRCFFHGPYLFLRLVSPLNLDSVLVLSACGWEGLAGGSCLSLLWQAAGSVQSPAFLPHIHQVEGIYQVSFPCQGRYSPMTRPVTLVDDGDSGGVDGSKTVSSGRCSSASGAVWVFCLASGGLLGVFWTPFGRTVFLRGALGLPWPPLGPGLCWPLWGPAGGLHVFPFLA
jgi:hypothetical protein